MSSRLPNRGWTQEPIYQRRDNSGVLSVLMALSLLGIIAVVVAMTVLALTVPSYTPTPKHWTQRP